MPLSKHYLDTQTNDIPVDFKGMQSLFENDYQEILFALLIGSASTGIIAKRSDIDIALYYAREPNWETLSGIMQSISDLHCDVRCDLGVLNHADPVYRYEALKGKLLFTRDQERWLRFYSLSCREYETQMFHYHKQRQYRLEIERQRNLMRSASPNT